jgi:hypothetical protein
MGKKAKKAKDKKSAPKKVAGVKVPKGMRKGGDSLASLVTSPLARELVADALIAIAGALAGNRKARDAAAKAGSKVAKAGAQAGSAAMDAGADAASGAKDMAQTATGAVAEVVTEAARRILPASLTGENDDDRVKGAGKKGDETRYAHLVDTPAQKKRKKTPEKHQGH